MEAHDFVFYVAGINGASGGLYESPAAASIGNGAQVRTSIFAQNGSITMNDNADARGAFLAKDISIARNVTITLDSYWQAGPEAALSQAEADAELTADELAGAALPETYALSQNYPNPFNPTTAIPFSLPEASHVKLQVFDMLGRLVETIVDGEMAAGFHQANFNARSYPSGAYMYRIEANGFIEVKQMMLIK